jgi:hypothetical protein
MWLELVQDLGLVTGFDFELFNRRIFLLCRGGGNGLEVLTCI